MIKVNKHTFDLNYNEIPWYADQTLEKAQNEFIILYIKCLVCGISCYKNSKSDLIYHSGLRDSLCGFSEYKLSCNEQVIKNVLE